MKKIAFALVVCFFVLGSFSGLFAVEKELVNFDKWEGRLSSDGVYPREDPARQQNRQNIQVDRTTGIPSYQITATDMLIRKWVVLLNSSAGSVEAKRYSMCKRVQTKGKYTPQKRYVLGARVHFPTGPFNAWAKIQPPFEIVAYDKSGKIVNVENGVADNTGQIYEISVEVNGRNYNNSITIRLKDETDEITDFFMGYLYYAGWKRLIWKNPNYIENVDIREIFRLPLYPRSKPFKKLDSFIVYRHGNSVGGDFVVYIANVKISYDLAVLEEEEDVDDEAVWRIITERQQARAEVERRRNAEIIELRRLEQMRQHNSEAIRRAEQQADQDAQQGGGTSTQPATTPATPATPAQGGQATPPAGGQQ